MNARPYRASRSLWLAIVHSLWYESAPMNRNIFYIIGVIVVIVIVLKLLGLF